MDCSWPASALGKLNWPLGLTLQDDRARRDPLALAHVADPQSHQITRPQLAIDAEIKQGEFARAVLDLQPDPNRPNVLDLQRRLLSDQLALVPGHLCRLPFRQCHFGLP